MIGTLLSLGLVTLNASPQAAGAAEAPAAPARIWRDVMIRRDTARQIIDDLPKTSARFRFECGFVGYEADGFFRRQLCVAAGEQPITDPARLADQARREAAQADRTAEDRLRRVAWLRAMLLHTQRDRGGAFETFTIEESVAASDLDDGPVSSGEVTAKDIVYVTHPSVQYPPSALRAGTEGRIELRCVILSGGTLHCETLTPYFTGRLAAPDGTVAVPSLLPLVAETHRASHIARVASSTRDGRKTEGLGFIFTIDFRLAE